MFIQRLQPKDIVNFLGDRYKHEGVTTYLEYKYTNTPYLYVSIHLEDSVINARLYDFENPSLSGNWQAFLYSKFGIEYKKEYIKYLDALMDKRIESMEDGAPEFDYLKPKEEEDK